MLLSLAYQLTRLLTELVLVRTGSDAQLRAEVLALCHQLRVLEHKVGKPAWQPGDRVLLAALSQLLPRSAWVYPTGAERRGRPLSPGFWSTAGTDRWGRGLTRIMSAGGRDHSALSKSRFNSQ